MKKQVLKIADLYRHVYGFKINGIMSEFVSDMDTVTFTQYYEALSEILEVKVKDAMKQQIGDDLADFSGNIIGMMADYDISMREAIVWEAENFGVNFNRKDADLLEKDIYWYLSIHNVKGDIADYYVDVLMHRSPDRVLIDPSEEESNVRD